jgi:tetratricopeptide (TPR) repeat protein
VNLSAAVDPSLVTASSEHLTDAQDRLSNATLRPAAERRTEADTFYAEAMLLHESLTGDPQRAIELFRKVVALDPSFMDARLKLADILLQTNQVEAAYAQLKPLASEHPDSIAVQVALGYTQHLRGQNDEARLLCTRVLSHDPNQTVAMRVLLEIAEDQRDLAGGVLHIEDLLRNGGTAVNAAPWLTLARLYLEIARSNSDLPEGEVLLETRLPMLQEAAAKPPPSVDTLTLLARTYLELGRKTSALESFRRAEELEPANLDVILQCAALEANGEKKAAAIADYEKAYAVSPDLSGLREMLGGLYLDVNRDADAVRVLQEAIAKAPDDLTLQIDLGCAYAQGHQGEAAESCFQKVFNAEGCPPEAYLSLAYFQLKHEQWKQAGRTLASAQAHFPDSPEVYFYEAIQNRYEKNYHAAEVALARVRALATGANASALDLEFYKESALIFNLEGEKEQFESTLREGVDKYPDNPELMNELAYLWADSGSHLQEALALSSRAAEIDPDNGPIQDTRGWVYYRMGQPKDALPYLQRAAFMTNNDPVVLQHVGDAYLKLGLRREAIATWIQALRKDPRNGELTNRIDAALAQAKNVHSRSAPTP